MSFTILLNGAKGRMGHAISDAAREMNITVGAACDTGDNPAASIAACDAVIDFSFHAATRAMLELAVAHDPVRYRDLVLNPAPKKRPVTTPGRWGQPPSLERPPANRPWRAA